MSLAARVRKRNFGFTRVRSAAMPLIGVIAYIALLAALGILTAFACAMFGAFVSARRTKAELPTDR
jgi:hypothetical protein